MAWKDVYHKDNKFKTSDTSITSWKNVIYANGKYKTNDGDLTDWKRVQYLDGKFRTDDTPQSRMWRERHWMGDYPLPTSAMWTDGDNWYNSTTGANMTVAMAKQVVLDRSTNTWVKKQWNGLTDFAGSFVWTDGTNIYWSDGYNHYVLNKATSTWETKTWHWDGFSSTTPYMHGGNIWTEGNNIYYSSPGSDNYQFVLDTSNDTWYNKTWRGIDYSRLRGTYIWKDENNNVYCSEQSSHYKLNKATDTWETVTWSPTNLLRFASQIWTDGIHTYCKGSSSQYQDNYVLDPTNNTWSIFPISGLSSWFGNEVWSDGQSIYHSTTHVLNKSTWSWEAITWDVELLIEGKYVWEDGTNVYHTYSGVSVILYPELSRYTYGVSWTRPYNNFSADNIWYLGDEIYYSYSTYQYRFDKTQNKWVGKTWTGLTNFFAMYIWVDGNTAYYSYNTNQYVLDSSTSTWTTKTWQGMTPTMGYYVWHDGDDIYCFYSGANYTLNRSTSTWEVVNWTFVGMPQVVGGTSVWTDGETVYNSLFNTMYDVQRAWDRDTGIWDNFVWENLTQFNSTSIWTHNGVCYCSEGGKQYALI